MSAAVQQSQAITTGIGTSTWTIDSAHSNVEFSVKHMMVSTVKGQFGEVEGTIDFDPARPESASVTATIDASSITTFNEMRDKHLRTNDFFNAEAFRYITFRSTEVVPLSETHFRVYGDLTIRDVTREVVLDTELDGILPKDAYGKPRAAFTATTEINRKDYGVSWNGMIEGGGVAVSEKVKITLHIAAVR
jgi:polyisoprenoid-binding protein YceI